MKTDSTQSIFASAKRFFSGTLLSRLSGMLRDVTMAFVFGADGAIAAFMVAFRFAHLFRRLFGEGALQAAFIPQFEELRKDSPQRASHFFRDLLASLSIFLTALIFVVMCSLGGILWLGDFSASTRQILFLTLLLMPSLLFICLFGLNASLLQCERIYFIPSVAPVIFNLTWILGVLIVSQHPSDTAMSWLAGFIVIACIGQWLITLPKVWSFLEKPCNISLRSEDLKRIGKPLLLGIIGVAATQINTALDAIFARYASDGGPALLWYAIRIEQLPLALFGIALSGALLPPLSRAIKAHDYVQYRQFLQFAVNRTLTIMLPMTFFLFFVGDACVNLIYGRGHFTETSTIGTVKCLWAYSLGLIPATLVLTLAPAFYAQNHYRIPNRASLQSVLLNVILNTFFIVVLRLGPASVALATSFSAWFNFAFLAYMLNREVEGIALRPIFLTVSKTALATAAASCVLLVLKQEQILGILEGSSVFFPRDFYTQTIQFGIEAGGFGITLIFAWWVLNIPLKRSQIVS